MKKKIKKNKSVKEVIQETVKRSISLSKYNLDYKMRHMSKIRAEDIAQLDEAEILNIVAGIKIDIEKMLADASQRVKRNSVKRLNKIKAQEKFRKRYLAQQKKYKEQKKKQAEKQKKNVAEKLILKETLTKEQVKQLKSLYGVELP